MNRQQQAPHPMTPTVEYEVFHEEKPSYVPSYIMSVFVLLGILSVAQMRIPVWPITLAHVVFAVWFGVLFKWILGNARQQKVFMSSRLTITDTHYTHSFRYAVSEATHVEIPLSEITTIKLSSEEPRYIEVIGESDDDIFFLPPSADVTALTKALLSGNAEIEIRN